MRFLDVLMYGGPPQPHPAPPADAWQPAPEPFLVAGILWLFFGPLMFLAFWMCLGELYDWWQQRGWRHPSRRRPLK